MTADPDDQVWRTAATVRMNGAAHILDRIGAIDPYPVEGDSDRAGDRAQFPDLWVDALACD